MSTSEWDRSLASADGLLTNEECSMLLDIDFFDDNDLLKTFPPSGPKSEARYEECLYPPSPPDTKPSRADLANDLLQQLDSQCKQENIFSNWLEEKVELPIFENIPQVERVEAPVTYAPPPPPTEELLREFESVYGAIELTHLTPPQSPPGPATQLLLSYAQQAQCSEPWPLPAPPALDFDPGLLEVDELVRRRAEALPSPAADGGSRSGSGSGSASPSPPSSPRSSDEEWGAPRPKPYARSADDRRSRKKEQNKNAATRYRQKKKAEIEVLLNEEQALRQRHHDLGDKCADLQREIRYLKGLMRDLFKAKGLIK